VQREFTASRPNELRLTDITEAEEPVHGVFGTTRQVSWALLDS
jgi:hypothetical protein